MSELGTLTQWWSYLKVFIAIIWAKKNEIGFEVFCGTVADISVFPECKAFSYPQRNALLKTKICQKFRVQRENKNYTICTRTVIGLTLES
jgi:hypothetical protein